MPSFPNVTDTRLEALLTFLKTGRDPISSAARGGTSEQRVAQPIQTGNRTEVVGARLYQKNCAICHGDDLLGEPSNDPALIGVRSRLGDDAILESIHNGKGRMPAFKKLTDADTSAILRFLGDTTSPIANQDGRSSKQEAESTGVSAVTPKYVFTGYRKFLDPDGYPAIVPPWGTLNAIDLNTGKYLWKIPLGEYPELAAKGMKNTGSENYGGPVVTAGGLVIIASTIFDRKIRAFDSQSGQLLWEAELPYAGNATPATYMVDGKQYIVIAASGARDRKGPQGAAYIAFALP
jgi:mono/diheme cytochrome c family protein